jgi:hypothetical protein
VGGVGPQSECKADNNCSAYVGTHSRAFQMKLVERMPRVCTAVKAKGGYFEESKIQNVF